MSFLFELLFSNPYAQGIVLVVVLFVAYQKLAPRLRIRVPGASLSTDDVLSKMLGARYREAKFEKAVNREKKQANFLAAGKLYEDAEKLQEAVDSYLEGSEFFAAATVLERMGKLEKAAELYLQSGDYKKAAQVFTDCGKPGKAAVLFQERGNSLEAARLYTLANQWDKAADLYDKAGYPARAAEAYQQKGDPVKAAECYERHFMENVTFSTTYSSTAPSKEQKSALLAGRLYEKAGDLNRAFQIYSKGEYFKEAATVLMKLGKHAKAAELYMRAEDQGSAAKAYEQAGDAVKAANLRGEVAFKAERIPEAAAFFQAGQDYLRAAELFESVGMLAEAAGAYEAGDSYAAAGGVYVRAGLKERAAASYERAGELETAAKLYEEAGNGSKAMDLYARVGQTFKSGEAAAKAGDRDRAFSLLQRVGPDDENYRAATAVLAHLFIESRMPGLAIERIQKALAGEPVSSSTLDLYYWLAVAYESTRKTTEAVGIFKKIQAEDLKYRDVEQRVARLQSPALGESGDRWAGTRREMHSRGIATLQICPSCGRCYDHRARSCSDDHSHLMAPRVIPYLLLDRYQLVNVLGQGGMGIVFRAHDKRLDRDVAIKIVNAEQFDDPSMRERLAHEARAVARVKHPGVIGLHDSGDLQDGSAFLVMELLDGCNLGRLLKNCGPGRPRQVFSLLRQAGEAIGAAHRAGVIHRDLKPQNIVLVNGPAGFQVKVVDFGLAKSTSVEAGVTHSGMIVGTPAYMSPEQINGPAVDARTDLYALAAVGFEALTGRRLVPEGDIMRMLYAVTHDPPPRVSSLVPGAPREVDETFARALAKDPAERPPDMASWVKSLEPLAGVPEGAGGWPDPIPASLLNTSQPVTMAPEKEAANPTEDVIPAAPVATPPAVRITAAPRPPAVAVPPAPVPSAPARAPAAPSTGARFVSKEELGRGPLGTVCRGEDRSNGQTVALRLLPPALLQRNGVLQALVNDLKAAAQVTHPNLVRVLGFVELGGQRCVVSELVSGRNFAEALRSGHKMPFAQVVSLGKVVGQVLAAIHAKKLAHGSIQPSNVMVASGVVKVTDLGLGRLALSLPSANDYRAPERQLDAAGDLYALAAVLYHLVTGVHPKSRPQLAPPSTLAAVTPAFDQLLRRSLAASPEQRCVSAEEFLRLLGAAVSTA